MLLSSAVWQAAEIIIMPQVTAAAWFQAAVFVPIYAKHYAKRTVQAAADTELQAFVTVFAAAYWQSMVNRQGFFAAMHGQKEARSVSVIAPLPQCRKLGDKRNMRRVPKKLHRIK